jgi:hypothetical protein
MNPAPGPGANGARRRGPFIKVAWRRLSKGNQIFLWIVFFLSAFYSILLWWIGRHNDVLSTAEIHTEYVGFTVVDRDRAAFQIDKMHLTPLGSNESTEANCVSGLFTPNPGTEIAYSRIGEGPVEITISPGFGATGDDVGQLYSDDQATPRRYSGPIIMQQRNLCLHKDTDAKHPVVRLPIWGYARIGREFKPARGAEPDPGLLIDGKLDVSAHAVWTGALYEVRSVTLPVASRLQAARAGQRDSDAKPIWWGLASVDSLKTGLLVNVATVAPRLELYRPNQTDAEVISVTSLVQLTDDPVLLRLQILVAVLFWLIGRSSELGNWLAELIERWKREKRNS